MATAPGLVSTTLGVMTEARGGPEIPHRPNDRLGATAERAQIQQAVVDPVEMNHIGLAIPRHRLERQSDPTGAQGAATIKAVGPQRQPIQLLQALERYGSRPARQHRLHTLHPWLSPGQICAQETTLHPVGHQALMQPERAP